MNSRRHQVGSFLRLGLGAAILASVALTGSSAMAGDVRFCSASSELSPTGRQNAYVTPSPREPWICLRYKIGGTAEPGSPDCWKVKEELGCTQVVDIN